MGFGGIVLAVGRSVINRLATALGVEYGASVVFLGAILFLLLVMHLSWEVSRLEHRTRALAEELALMRGREEQGPHQEGASISDAPFATGPDVPC